MIEPTQENNILNDANFTDDSNVITSMDGFDTIYAGTGDDIVIGSDGADILDGGEGIDTLDYQYEELMGVTINLYSNSASGGQAEGDIISNFENISGSQVGDLLVGDDGDNKLNGRGGQDTLTGGEGSDTFELENLSDSTLYDFDTITDLNIGEDQISGANPVDFTEVTQFGSIDFLDEVNIQTVLSESEFAAYDAGVFSYDSQVFLVLNDGVAGYSADSDGIIEITGVTGFDLSLESFDLDVSDESGESDEFVNLDDLDESDDSDELSNFDDSSESNELDDSSQVINVDDDFGGDLESAIATAEDGDTILLSSNTYFTDGITIDRDITIEGEEGTTIDGGGTSESILNLTSGATGTTIQDLEITNGNNGIYGSEAQNLTILNLEINNIGLNNTIRDGQNNTAIFLDHAEGLQLVDINIYDVGRKGVAVNDTDGAFVSNLSIQNVNLAAEHSQSFDAAGIKLFNTNDVIVQDLYISNVNAVGIWNDTTNGTKIRNNVIENVGNVFAKPDFDENVTISGIYNEKSSNSSIQNNRVNAIEGFLAFNATEFSTETMILDNNDFSGSEINTTDFWVNEEAEKLVAITEDPKEAGFSLFAEDFLEQVNTG